MKEKILDLISHYKHQQKLIQNDFSKNGIYLEDESKEIPDNLDCGALIGNDDIYSVVIKDLENLIND
jgi:hypothetical protein